MNNSDAIRIVCPERDLGLDHNTAVALKDDITNRRMRSINRLLTQANHGPNWVVLGRPEVYEVEGRGFYSAMYCIRYSRWLGGHGHYVSGWILRSFNRTKIHLTREELAKDETIFNV